MFPHNYPLCSSVLVKKCIDGSESELLWLHGGSIALKLCDDTGREQTDITEEVKKQQT